MLILTRSKDQKIRIGHDITITVLAMSRGIVKLGIDAPRDVIVDREEIYIARNAVSAPVTPK